MNTKTYQDICAYLDEKGVAYEPTYRASWWVFEVKEIPPKVFRSLIVPWILEVSDSKRVQIDIQPSNNHGPTTRNYKLHIMCKRLKDY